MLDPESSELPFPIPYKGDYSISIEDIDKNTNLILGSIDKWGQPTGKSWIKVEKSLIFITNYEQIGENWLIEMCDSSDIPFEGTVSDRVLERHNPHFGMAFYACDFTVLFGSPRKPHAIITPRNVIKIFSNIHHVE